MKNNIDAVIVVEGRNDESYISSFFDALFVVTNGYEMPKEEMDFLTHLPKDKKIIILTDSDVAGEEIRNRINDQIPNAINLKIDISKCNKHNKHGVAESEKEELIKLLTPYISEPSYGNITLADLLNLKIDKEKLAESLHLGKVNTKTLIKRLNYINIDIETIKKYGN